MASVPTVQCFLAPLLVFSSGKMFLVGLTGGIASGKSSVIQVFQQLGCAVIDVDVIARHGELGGGPSAAPVLPFFHQPPLYLGVFREGDGSDRIALKALQLSLRSS